MRVLAIEMRTAGYRSYENGVIDVGAVYLDHDHFAGEFHTFVRPVDDRAYRPASLKAAGLTLAELEEIGKGEADAFGALREFVGAQGMPPVAWTLSTGPVREFGDNAYHRNASAHRMPKLASAQELFAVLGAYAVHSQNPDKESVMFDRYGVALSPRHTAIERAKACALLVSQMTEELRSSFAERGLVEVPALPPVGGKA